MDKETIIKAVDGYIGSCRSPYNQYAKWRIGITQDIEGRKAYHKGKGRKIGDWKDWKADSLRVAQDVENHFLNKTRCNPDGGTGGNMKPNKTTYVYVL